MKRIRITEAMLTDSAHCILLENSVHWFPFYWRPANRLAFLIKDIAIFLSIGSYWFYVQPYLALILLLNRELNSHCSNVTIQYTWNDSHRSNVTIQYTWNDSYIQYCIMDVTHCYQWWVIIEHSHKLVRVSTRH